MDTKEHNRLKKQAEQRYEAQIAAANKQRIEELHSIEIVWNMDSEHQEEKSEEDKIPAPSGRYSIAQDLKSGGAGIF